MTGPQPYPGDVVDGEVVGPVAPGLRFVDPLGRPLNGTAHITNEISQTVEVDIVDGDLQVDLPSGTYRIVGMLTDPDGHPAYRIEQVIV